jgi:hypothetical protein
MRAPICRKAALQVYRKPLEGHSGGLRKHAKQLGNRRICVLFSAIFVRFKQARKTGRLGAKSMHLPATAGKLSTAVDAATAAPDERGRLRVVVTHPFARKKAKGWGTEH